MTQSVPGIVAVALVSVVTLAIGAYGWRFSRTTSDFLVASRSVGPGWNASAIGGEYLSAGSFLGVAGLVLAFGTDMLWYPIGWTGGYLVMLALVAAPLRRSGAYTVPDFAEARLESLQVRRFTALLVVALGSLYLIPQFHGAGLALGIVAGTDPWVGATVVGVVVLANVLLGGMRSITFVQAFQYWLKLSALLVPALFLLGVWLGDGAPSPVDVTGGAAWSDPASTSTGSAGLGLYSTYSIIIATFLGTVGLPHVVVRFYTNPDGRQARRTTLVVLGLLGLFYVLPPVYAALGRLYASDLVASGNADSVVLTLPSRMVGGDLGTALSALTAAGAFAAFLSTSGGLTVAVAGVLSQELQRRRSATTVRDPRSGVRPFQAAAVVALAVPLLVALAVQGVGVAEAVGLAFAFAASTLAPLILLGIWWRGLTDAGALAGLAVGGAAAGTAIVDTWVGAQHSGWLEVLLTHPAAWSAPLAFATMVVVSWLTPRRVPLHVDTTMVRLHTPEALPLDRGPALR